MDDRLRRFTHDCSGNTAVEYAIILAFIAVVVLGTLHAIGINLDTAFDMVASGLTNLL